MAAIHNAEPGTFSGSALQLAEHGFKVFPVHWIKNGRCSCGKSSCSVAKHPLIDSWQQNATTDPATIKSWGSKWPHANVGIATGADSGIVVIDLDVRDSVNGIEAYTTLQGVHSTPSTAIAVTGSGGVHVYFRSPGHIVKNSASRLGDGVDVRGDGGYVVAPPSCSACN